MTELVKVEEKDITPLPAGLGLAMNEIEAAIALAQKRPRDEEAVKAKIEKLAILDPECAHENVYALPRGGKPIRGPSIRLAEIISTCYRNNLTLAMVKETDRVNKVVKAVGIFYDLEGNVIVSKEQQRRISDKNGRLFSEDMITVTQNAACSIALRNAILSGVPRSIWRKAFVLCEQVLAGDIATLVERREKAFKAFAAFGIKPEQLCAVLEVPGVESIDQEHMPTLIAMHASLKSGEATVEEMFDPRKHAITHEVITNPLRDEGPAEKAEIPIDYKVIGVAAHKQGVPRDRPPGELRSADRAADLREWLSGWDSAG